MSVRMVADWSVGLGYRSSGVEMASVAFWFAYGTGMPALGDRERYPNAPLKLVACEVRYQLAPGVDFDAVGAGVYESVGEDYPVRGQPYEQEVRFEPGAAAPTLVTGGFRYLDLGRTKSIAAGSSALVVETSAYTTFEEFAGSIDLAMEALQAHARVVSVERVGLRYIDELMVEELPGRTLEGFFDEKLLALGEARPGLGTPTEFLATASYGVGVDRQAVLRAGRVNQPIVTPTGPLRIAAPSKAPLYAIDVDCNWSAEATSALPFDRAVIGALIADLHVHVRSLFESAITEKLREDVLRMERQA